ncbi:DUF4184 family protein [Paenibacillus harenae]|uniref:DUF4184 family protein n=1 Tax=Paenibacillus harenae TaxID=306543 RepID=UPI002790E3FE|nr:DUF4184 family protein [Paenibacillus harenae]MDQ0059758.1 hypothetical protein [Paenibacillus harenae]
MPFTLAHPLYAVPLRRLVPSLSISGLVLGSMAPDMEYFVAMQPYRSIGHSFIGFLAIGLPLSIVIAIAFHCVIAPRLHTFMPVIGGFNLFVQQQLLPRRLAKKADWAFFVLSLWIGFMTHVFVDHFTHSGGWFVQRMPALQGIVAGEPVHHWLQHSLSALGLAIPAILLLRRWRRWYQHAFSEGSYAPSHAWPFTRRSDPWKHALLAIVCAAPFLLGKLLLSGQWLSISLWAVAPLTSFCIGLYFASLLIEGGGNRKKDAAAHKLVAIAAPSLVFLIYALVDRSGERPLMIWIGFIWLLSASILTGAIIGCRNRMRK